MGLRDDASRPELEPAPATLLVLAAVERQLSSDEEAAWLDALPSARRDSLLAWPDRRERHRSLIGTRLLLEALRRLGVGADALASLRHAPRQRPTLDLPLDFSLSHTEGLVVCAVAREGSIGIDVERVGRVEAAAFVRYLSTAEREAAGGEPRRFCATWTRKEAIVKAAGSEGLAALPRIDTAAHPDRVAFDGRTWHTMAVPVGDGFIAHVATDRADATLRFESIDPG